MGWRNTIEEKAEQRGFQLAPRICNPPLPPPPLYFFLEWFMKTSGLKLGMSVGKQNWEAKTTQNTPGSHRLKQHLRQMDAEEGEPHLCCTRVTWQWGRKQFLSTLTSRSQSLEAQGDSQRHGFTPSKRGLTHHAAMCQALQVCLPWAPRSSPLQGGGETPSWICPLTAVLSAQKQLLQLK